MLAGAGEVLPPPGEEVPLPGGFPGLGASKENNSGSTQVLASVDIHRARAGSRESAFLPDDLSLQVMDSRQLSKGVTSGNHDAKRLGEESESTTNR